MRQWGAERGAENVYKQLNYSCGICHENERVEGFSARFCFTNKPLYLIVF
jgi:hypothetical protein